jgi:recombinase
VLLFPATCSARVIFPTPPPSEERIAAMRDDGMTLVAIAGQLNADGIPTARGGKRWWPSTVGAVLNRAS